jgi:hypothetical protein
MSTPLDALVDHTAAPPSGAGAASATRMVGRLDCGFSSRWRQQSGVRYVKAENDRDASIEQRLAQMAGGQGDRSAA